MRRTLCTILLQDYYQRVLKIPVRPYWDKTTSKLELERNETRYFEHWLQSIYKQYDVDRLNHFEHNLEVWRQLWRVCERSDLLLIVCDARHPLFHFPPSLYDYVTAVCNKPLVVVLNKIDLVPLATLKRWVAYFQTRFPLVGLVPFTSFPPTDLALAYAYDAPGALTWLGGKDGDGDGDGGKGGEKGGGRVGHAKAGMEGEVKVEVDYTVDSTVLRKSTRRRGGANVIRPLGADQLLEHCARVLQRHHQQQPQQQVQQQQQKLPHRDYAPNAPAVASSSSSSFGLPPAPSAVFGVPVVSFDAAHLLSEKDLLKREQVRLKEERMKRERLEQLRAAEIDKKFKELRLKRKEVEAKGGAGVGIEGEIHGKSGKGLKGKGRKGEEDDDEDDEEDEEDDGQDLEKEEDEEEEAGDETVAGFLGHLSDVDEEEEGREEDDEDAEEEEEEREDMNKRQARGGRKGREEDPDEKESGSSPTNEKRAAVKAKIPPSTTGRATETSTKTKMPMPSSRTFLTIGTIGYPNVGKSSLINALAGKKVVSVSRQPGHTKHLQTLFLNASTRLCDCPGLVFPAVDVPKEMQVLAGVVPIPQVGPEVHVRTYMRGRQLITSVVRE